MSGRISAARHRRFCSSGGAAIVGGMQPTAQARKPTHPHALQDDSPAGWLVSECPHEACRGRIQATCLASHVVPARPQRQAQCEHPSVRRCTRRDLGAPTGAAWRRQRWTTACPTQVTHCDRHREASATVATLVVRGDLLLPRWRMHHRRCLPTPAADETTRARAHHHLHYRHRHYHHYQW